MRITSQMMTDHAVQYMSQNLERMHGLQNRISSGKKFQNISDDPTAATLSLSLRSTLSTVSAYLDANQSAQTWLNANESVFDRMESIAQRAITLATRGINDTLSAEERSAIGKEMGALLTEAVQAGNETHAGQSLFAGYQLNTKPFEMPDENTVIFSANADNGVMKRTIGPNETLTINIDGEAAFLPFLQQVLVARNALNSNNPATLETALTGLQNGLNTIAEAHTTNGTRIRQAASAEEYATNVQIEMEDTLSKNEDVNMAEAIAQLRAQESNYQVVLEVSQRAVSALSLFDYLR